MKRLWRYFGLLVLVGLAPSLAFAHEAYVLTRSQFAAGLADHSLNAWSSLSDPGNVALTIKIAVAITIAMVLAFLVRHSAWGRRTDAKLKSYSHVAHLITRVALAGSFFFAGLTFSILGPELPLNTIPLGTVVQLGLMISSVLLLIGLLTPIAAAIGLLSIGLAASTYGAYIFTYLNYVAELFVLLVLGAQHFSVDRWLKWFTPWWKKLIPYEATIVRVGYGLALMYAAVNVKLLHPMLTVMVVRQYNLTQFHWLFPPDPLLITLGAAITEFMIGFLIAIGLQVRFVTIVTLFYITLSLAFFREAVWPHFLLYGIGLALLIHGGGKLTLDEWFDGLIMRSSSKVGKRV